MTLFTMGLACLVLALWQVDLCARWEEGRNADLRVAVSPPSPGKQVQLEFSLSKEEFVFAALYAGKGKERNRISRSVDAQGDGPEDWVIPIGVRRGTSRGQVLLDIGATPLDVFEFDGAQKEMSALMYGDHINLPTGQHRVIIRNEGVTLPLDAMLVIRKSSIPGEADFYGAVLVLGAGICLFLAVLFLVLSGRRART